MIDLAAHLLERKLSWETAADRTGIAVQRLREIAEGADISVAEMRRLSNGLRLPLPDFFPSSDQSQLSLFFRSAASNGSQKIGSGLNSIAWRIEGILQAGQESLAKATWIDHFRSLDAKHENADAFARAFRKKFFGGDLLNPIQALPELVSDVLGVLVLVVRDLAAEGVSAVADGKAMIFLAPRKFRARMLLTLAHELGHIVARHHEANRISAIVDSKAELDSWRESASPEEKFATAFAASLLLPQSGVVEALRKYRAAKQLSGPIGDVEICVVARLFGVSFEVAGRRIESLGLLPRHGARTLYDYVVERHKSPEKRADDVGLPARDLIDFPMPAKLIAGMLKSIKSGALSIGKAAEILGVAPSEILEIGAEVGW